MITYVFLFFLILLTLRYDILWVKCISWVQRLCLCSIVSLWSCPRRSGVFWMSISRLRIVLLTRLFCPTLSCVSVWLRLISFWLALIARVRIRCMIGGRLLLLSPHLSLCSATIFRTFLRFFFTFNDLLHLSLLLSIGLLLSRLLTVILRIRVVWIIVGLTPSLILAAGVTITFPYLLPSPSLRSIFRG